MWRLVGVAWHGQACAGTVDNTVSSGEITEATDDVHCRAVYFRFTVGKIPIRIDANGRSGACPCCGLVPPFSAAASDECAISSENRWRYCRKYGRQRDLQVMKVGWRLRF